MFDQTHILLNEQDREFLLAIQPYQGLADLLNDARLNPQRRFVEKQQIWTTRRAHDQSPASAVGRR